MITLDYLGANKTGWDSTILASDISNKVLQAAKEGVYPEEQISDLPNNWQKKYFLPQKDGHYVASDVLRNNVVYRNFNLLSPFQYKKPFQAIFCRNVMIYFEAPVKEQIVNKFYNALLPGGYLFVGLSESLSGLNHKFKSVRPSIYRKVE
jgi:chemotaxis protein methyltransferase CheR